MSTFKDWISKNKDALLAGSSILAVGAIVYIFVSRNKGQEGPQSPEGKKSSTTQNKNATDSNTTPLTTPRSEADIKVGYVEGTKILDKDTLTNIHALIAKRMSSRYMKKSIEARKIRRAKIDDLQTYIKECKSLQEALGQLIQQITARILIELKLDPESYQTAFEYHTKKEPNQEFLDKVAQPDPDLVPSAKKLDKKKVKDMYNYQISVLEEVVTELTGALGKTNLGSEIDYLIDFRLLDLSSLNLGIEEEDLLNKFNAPLVNDDSDIKALIGERDRVKGSLITRLA